MREVKGGEYERKRGEREVHMVIIAPYFSLFEHLKWVLVGILKVESVYDVSTRPHQESISDCVLST